MKRLSEESNLNYTQIIKQIQDEEGILYLGHYLEIPESRTHARDMNILMERMKEVLELSIESRLNHNEEIPVSNRYW